MIYTWRVTLLAAERAELPRCWIASVIGVAKTTPEKIPKTRKNAAIIPATVWCCRCTLLQRTRTYNA